ncbi:MAG: Fpg/Nei family DNA glycosylase [Actinobacteria bacterium]|nr:Fpg/Nei family DNA glycosylase [Actinomycetota bacterium]
MPEGDAVRRSARALDAALRGREVLASDIRVPRFATVDLRGQRVLGTHAVGKHLLTRTDAGLTLHSHRRMEGRWVTGPADLRTGPAHQIRVILRTADSAAIGVRLAMVEIAPTTEERRWVGHLGPDILADDFDPGLPLPENRPLVEMLLDQRVIAGLGTMWAAEVAFAAGCSPYVRDAQVGAALARIREQMLDSVQGARPRMNVFERTGQPCRVCGAQIRRGRVGRPPQDRVTYWCPVCQGDDSHAVR